MEIDYESSDERLWRDAKPARYSAFIPCITSEKGFDSVKILTLEPYYGGSHRQFLEGWRKNSAHEWKILGLAGRHWKKRMLRGAQQLAEQVAELAGEKWDILFCSDMLDLAKFQALAPVSIAALPKLIYFHENQLTYPMPEGVAREEDFGQINIRSALAADRIWFNSDYHRRSLLAALPDFLKKMPDLRCADLQSRISGCSEICPPGIPKIPAKRQQKAGKLHILWTARWEYDKDPEAFFRALSILRRRGIEFHLSVVGGHPRGRMAPLFRKARNEFSDQIKNWGWEEKRSNYLKLLRNADLVVSTARHEFFGIGILEAVGAGVYPLVPDRLAYPEVLDKQANPNFFYGGDSQSLADKLTELAYRKMRKGLPENRRGPRLAQRFFWSHLGPKFDAKLEELRNLQPESDLKKTQRCRDHCQTKQ